MKIAISKSHLRIAIQLLGAVFALGCGSTDLTRSDSASPASRERAASDSGATDGSDQATAANGADPSSSSALNPPAKTAANQAARRVVGYLPVYRSLDPSAVDLDTLTHLNIAFALPKTVGSELTIDFSQGQGQIVDLVAAAHKKNVKVLAAIGGGSRVDALAVADALSSDSVRFVDSTVALLAKYDFDGIDIDIEGEFIVPDTYEKLVNGLVANLPAGKLLTAAVGNNLRANYRALDKLDFLNVMSYDQCGACSAPSPHSTYEQAELDLKYWSSGYWQEKEGRGVYDKSRVVLGVPFYGYCWGLGCSQTAGGPGQAGPVPYFQLSAFWSASKPDREEPIPDVLKDDAKGYEVSLNGPETIGLKAMLAKNYGGIMIWELGQDAIGPSSLFSVIRNTR